MSDKGSVNFLSSLLANTYKGIVQKHLNDWVGEFKAKVSLWFGSDIEHPFPLQWKCFEVSTDCPFKQFCQFQAPSVQQENNNTGKAQVAQGHELGLNALKTYKRGNDKQLFSLNHLLFKS